MNPWFLDLALEGPYGSLSIRDGAMKAVSMLDLFAMELAVLLVRQLHRGFCRRGVCLREAALNVVT